MRRRRAESTDIVVDPPEAVAGDVAVENILLHVLPRGRGATIPGTGRRPGQTAERARSANEITTSCPLSGDTKTGFSRTFDEVGRFPAWNDREFPGKRRPVCRMAAPRRSQRGRHVIPHAAFTTRALSKTKPARPYICRLMVFSRFT